MWTTSSDTERWSRFQRGRRASSELCPPSLTLTSTINQVNNFCGISHQPVYMYVVGLHSSIGIVTSVSPLLSLLSYPPSLVSLFHWPTPLCPLSLSLSLYIYIQTYCSVPWCAGFHVASSPPHGSSNHFPSPPPRSAGRNNRSFKFDTGWENTRNKSNQAQRLKPRKPSASSPKKQ